MHDISTALAMRRSRAIRGLTITASVGLVLAALPAGVAAASGPQTWVVHSGESIQAAVDKASSGDTIRIEAGTYQEAVCVDGKGLTIEGAGRGEDGTKIVWPEWTTLADLPEPTSTPCWEAQNEADPESNPDTLADDVSGLFFLNPDSEVRVRDLSTWNHPANGIAAWGADGFRVYKTKGHGHDRYGILAANSTHTRISRNIEEGVDRGTADSPNSGTAGIGSTDSDQAYADIVANDVQGFNLGIFARESRVGVVRHNYVSGNCVGVLIFDDAATEIPDASRNVASGDWTIRANESTANDRFCLAGIGEVEASLRVSGTGMGVVNADTVAIYDNTITDTKPAVDPTTLQFPAAGLALLSLPPFNNPLHIDPGPVEDVQVWNNTITGNSPVDILRGWPPGVTLNGATPPPVGGGIDIRGNDCGTSLPAELCGS
jgi:nitrous oxidase accessory protein NosD